MSIRIVALYLFVAGLSVYAWKDWFKSLCALILMMAIIQRDDMPKSVLGIQGLNPWNVLFIAILLAWATSRRREGLRWDMPRSIVALLGAVYLVIGIGVLRSALNPGYFDRYPLSSLISEELINSTKWLLPGILLFDGCRTRHRLLMALTCLLAVYFLISIQVISRMPFQAAIDPQIIHQNARRLDNAPGYCATDVSVMLAGASWGMLAVMPLVRRGWRNILVLGTAGAIAFGQALTGGRAGYIAWCIIGCLLCLLKWRKYLVFVPVAIVLVILLLPGVTGRILEGYGKVDVAGESTTDAYAATSGRLFVWPYVIEEIGKSPWIGYGRIAMARIGLSQRVGLELEDDSWPHPHNMYLESLLDNGILGSMPFFTLFGVMVVFSAKLFRNPNRLYSAIGGLSLSLTASSLLGGLSGQHVYLLEHTLGMWAAFFLVLRVRAEEKRAQVMLLAADGIPEVPWVARQRHPVLSMGDASPAAEVLWRD